MYFKRHFPLRVWWWYKDRNDECTQYHGRRGRGGKNKKIENKNERPFDLTLYERAEKE